MNKQPESRKPSSKEQPKAHPIHPETKKNAEQLPGDESSTATYPGQPDARTNADKDGNAEQIEKNGPGRTPQAPKR